MAFEAGLRRVGTGWTCAKGESGLLCSWVVSHSLHWAESASFRHPLSEEEHERSRRRARHLAAALAAHAAREMECERMEAQQAATVARVSAEMC